METVSSDKLKQKYGFSPYFPEWTLGFYNYQQLESAHTYFYFYFYWPLAQTIKMDFANHEFQNVSGGCHFLILKTQYSTYIQYTEKES